MTTISAIVSFSACVIIFILTVIGVIFYNDVG